MALDKFKAAPLPNAPAQYDPQYIRQIIRVLENYFSQLDSNTPNHAEKYTADSFVGGSFTGTDIVANSVATSLLSAQLALIDYQSSNGIRTDALISNGHFNGAQISDHLMAQDIYADFFYGNGRYIQTPYNQFQSLVDQTAASVADANALSLEVTDFVDGIYITGASNSRITFTYAGVYTTTFSLSFKNTTNDGQTIDIWFRYKGVNIADSNSRFFIAPRKSTGDPSYLIATTPYTVITVADADYIEIMWRVSDVGVTLDAAPAVAASPGVTPAIPATPSALVQVVFASDSYPITTYTAPLPVFGFAQVGSVSVVTR